LDTPERKRKWLHTGWIAGLILLLGVIVLITGRAEERQFAVLLRRSEPPWLMAAAVLQALTYLCTAAGWRTALFHFKQNRTLWELIPLGLAKLFTDQAVPSVGLSGNVLLMHALTRRRIPREAAMGTVLLALVGYYGAYVLCVGAALLILWLWKDLSRLLLTLATVFSLLAVTVPLGVFWLRRHHRLLPARLLRRFPLAREILAALETTPEGMGTPALIARVVAWQGAVFLLDTSTLFVMLRAVGHPAGFLTAFASFIIASVFATLMVVPGGLGTFEGASVAMLHLFGVPLAPALAATLLLRGFTFWLPMLPGLWLARREMFQGADPLERGKKL
jgi:uncharacterized protein (TIRG00374 family)